MAISASIIPGKVFEEGEAVNISTLNLLGNPTVNIEGAVSGLGIEDDSITDAKVNSVAAIATSKLALSSAIEVDGANVGIGCTPSAWSAVGGVLQIGSGLGLMGNAVSSSSLLNNAYYDGAYKLIGAGAANRLSLTSGSYSFQYVASGSADDTISEWTTAMAIDSVGDVSLKTSGAKLSFLEAGAGSDYMSLTNAAGPKLQVLNSSGSDIVTFENGGSVGIGGTANQKLSINTTSGNGLVGFQIDDSQKAYIGVSKDADAPINGMVSGDLGIRVNDASFCISTQSGATQDVIVDSSGNCGIGCTPSYPLHVAGADDQYIAIQNTGADSTGGYILYNDARTWTMRVDGADSDKFQIRDGTADAQRLTIDSSGNCGIATPSPQKTLDVAGTFAISNSTTSYWDFDRDDSDGSLIISDTGTARMTINSSGYVILANVPEGSSGLDSGTIYKDSSGYLKTAV